MLFCALPVLVLLYDFLKDLDRSLALLAAFVNLAAIALLPWLLVPCLVGERSLTLWLLVKGVGVRSPRAAPVTP